MRRRAPRVDAGGVRTDPFETEELVAGTQRARAIRYDRHPLRAWRERHPTLARGIIEVIALCILAGLLVHHLAH